MTDRIERELLLPARPDEVWEVVTGPGWLADQVQLDLVPGGEAHFSSSESVKTGWVEEALPPELAANRRGRLSFWWAEGDDPATRVELTLEPAGEDTTLLRVLETRPLDLLDLVGTPIRGAGGQYFGPALVAA
jgi:hypothetical protein